MERQSKPFSRIVFGVLLLSAAAAVILANLDSGFSEPEPGGEGEYLVERVVDGDTVVCASLGKVRLLGIDTPERGEEGYEEARDRLTQLIGGRWATLYFDEVLYDRYGRVLGYPVVDGVEVCPLLVAEGLAEPYFISPNERFRERILTAAMGR